MQNARISQFVSAAYERGRSIGLKHRKARQEAVAAAAKEYETSERTISRIERDWKTQDCEIRRQDAHLLELAKPLLENFATLHRWVSAEEIQDHEGDVVSPVMWLALRRATATVDELKQQIVKLRKCAKDRAIGEQGLTAYSSRRKR